MASSSIDAGFIVWGIDQTAYGPVELPSLVSWVKDGRITAETWIFAVKDCSWQRAADLLELQMFFHELSAGSESATMESLPGIEISSLRRIKILAGMSDEQLERFAQFIEVEKFPHGSVIVKQGDPEQSMYLVLEGELSVRINVLGEQAVMATLGVGDFFGDISVFDHGPRSADVTASSMSVLVKISAAAFQRLAKEAPDLATPFLLAIGKTLTARIRAGNKHYGESIKFARAVK